MPLALALSYAGMAGLCLGMDRHHVQVWPRKSRARQRLLRLAGWLLLAAALWPCLRAWGGAVGTVVWCGVLTAGALALVLLLPYRPRLAAWLAAFSTLGALPLLAL
nr:DUF3325 domain-containing protein [Pseudomonas carbonaria]